MLLTVMALGAFSCAIISTITGLVAVIKNKERAVLVYLCILIGALEYIGIGDNFTIFKYLGLAQIVGEIMNSY